MKRLIPLLCLLSAPAAAQEVPRFGKARTVTQVDDPRLVESSGVARSRRDPELLWTHNDSGGQPVLYAFDRAGAVRGVVRVAGAAAIDWEDMASFELGKRPFLLVADVGDNPKARAGYTLYVVPEPKLTSAEPASVEPALVIHLRYPGGPRNCEAVAVDPVAKRIYLATREERERRSEVFSLALPERSTKEPVEAQPVTELPLKLVTAMDMSDDGLRAVVITYSTAYLYARTETEEWAAAFARGPVTQLRLPKRRQGEAVCYGPDGRSLLLTSEYGPMPLLEVPAEESREEEPTEGESE